MTSPTTDVVFDKQDQLDRVQELLLPGEKLAMVFDCKGRGSGFVGITDRRIIIRDDGFAKYKKSTLSIPYAKIHAVGVDSEKGWGKGSSSLAVSAGDDDWLLEFKGEERAKDAYFAVIQHVLA